ncbi:MAG: TonB-dependent receptor [Rhodothermales bacterium]|nr:TonB-dependent receptor [Rhodothermales bacterium]
MKQGVAGMLLALLAVQSAGAQSVEGRVMDAGALPLAGAAVQLFEAGSGSHRYGAAVAADGTFRLAPVPPGRYLLVVSHVGFAEHRETVMLAEGETVRVRAVLSARAVPQPEVVVTANRARERLTPVTFSNLPARTLEVLPAMKDLPVHLATLPSVTYYSENGNGIGYSALQLRGFGQRRVAVAINGIPQNDPEDYNVFWINFFDVQGAVRDVQVQRGASGAFYGSTGIGGGINIVARPYRPTAYAMAEVGAGAFATRRFTAEANSGLRGGRYVAFGRFSRLLSDGYRDWSWTAFWRFFGGVVRYGERHTVTLQGYGGPQRDGLAFSGIPKAANTAAVPDGFGGTVDRRSNPSAVTEDVEHFHQPHLEVLHTWQVRPGLEFHQSLFGIQGKGFFDFGGTFRSADYLRLPPGWRGLTAEARQLPLFLVAPDVRVQFRAYLDQWQLGWMPRLTRTRARSETTLGAEVRLHRSLRWGRIQEGEGVPPEVVGGGNDVRVYSIRGEKGVASLYGSHLARPHPRLAVQADLGLTGRRYRVYDEAFFGTDFAVPYLFLNPRLGITVNPERPWSAYASVALAGREPRLKALYDGEEAGAGFVPQFEPRPDGTPDFGAPRVRPEYLLDLEAGGSLTRMRYRLTANVYWMAFRDEIVPSGGLDQFGVPRTGNAERTRHLGVEVEGAVRLLPGLDVAANATVSRDRFVRFTEFVTLPDFTVAAVDRGGSPIAGFPERSGSARAEYRRGGLTATLTGRYAGRRFIDNSGGVGPEGAPDDALVVDPYVLLDATLRYALPAGSWLEGFSVALDVNNVLDRRVLLYGNVGFGTPQFFPAATRHGFASIRYTVR